MNPMALTFVLLGFIFLVAHVVLLYRMRKEVNARIRTPFERIPAVMFSLSFYRMLRLHRQSFRFSWLRQAAFLTEIGCALCLLEAIKFAGDVTSSV